MAEASTPTLTRVDTPTKERKYPCKSCGADVVFVPGSTHLTCPYCNTVEAIPLSGQAIREYSLSDYLPAPKTIPAEESPFRSWDCGGCGGQIEISRTTAARPCPYCGSTLVVTAGPETKVQPEAILPFAVPREQAEKAVHAWIASRWFAPNDLKAAVTVGRFTSLYLPWWTFDSHTLSHYEGEAGYHYTVTVGEGKNKRTETRTRWEWRSGVYEHFFDDVLVAAGEFRAWNKEYQLTACVPYETAYTAGHSAFRTTAEPTQGWPQAKAEIETEISAACRRLIGGDTQRNVQISTAHRGVTYKLVLLPRWQGGYRYRDQAFQITVNGQTGVVTGDRPWSVIKITMAVFLGLAVVGGIIWVIQQQQQEQVTLRGLGAPRQVEAQDR